MGKPNTGKELTANSLLSLVVPQPTPSLGRHTHTQNTGRSPLNEGSAHSSSHYLHNTQQTQETNINVLSGIRTRDASNQTA